MKSPYQGKPKRAFWKSGVTESSPFALDAIYEKKWPINPKWRIATAGSCFAQHIARNLRSNGYKVLDAEPAPKGLPRAVRNSFGYSLYSARYANIYTVRQLLQLTREVAGSLTPDEVVWEKNGRYFDAFRPAVEPVGLDSPEEVLYHRAYHLSRVRFMLEKMHVFIFTLGLTEAWSNRDSGLVFPTAPGTIAGQFDDKKYQLINFQYPQIVDDFTEFLELVKVLRNGVPLKIILTVSPVPLTATATDHHVLCATTYSKSVLRAAAGFLAETNPDIDYFPSYEIVTNPAARGTFFENNLRSVSPKGVEMVMRTFFNQHAPVAQGDKDRARAQDGGEPNQSDADVQCEDALLEAFG